MSLLPSILLLLSWLAAADGFPVARLPLHAMSSAIFFLQNMEFSKDGAKEAAARGSGDEEAGLDGGDPADLK